MRSLRATFAVVTAAGDQQPAAGQRGDRVHGAALGEGGARSSVQPLIPTSKRSAVFSTVPSPAPPVMIADPSGSSVAIGSNRCFCE